MRTYRWGWDNPSWPHFSVEVPDDSELAIATTMYEVVDNPGLAHLPALSSAKVITVKLVFIDPAEDADALFDVVRPSLSVIEREKA